MMEKDLPEGWEEVQLGEIIKVSSGDGLTSKQMNSEGEIPVFGGNGINGYHDIANTFEKTIVIGRVGFYCGCVHLTPEKAWVTDNALKVKYPIGYIDQNYLFWVLTSLNLRQFTGSTAQPVISGTKIYEREIPLPPLAEQKRIVAKLNAAFGLLDRMKERLARIPELLKTFRQAVLTQAVTGKLTEEWREENGFEEEWKFELAKDCCIKVQSGGTPKPDGFSDIGIPFLKVYNIVNNNIDFHYRPQFVTQEAHNSRLKKSICLPGDVLMNIVGPPLNKIAIIPNTYKEWNHNQAITLFRTKNYLINTFLYYFFCEGSSVKSLYNETRGVVGQVNISLSQCREFEIPIPPLAEQQEIVRRVEALLAKADALEAQYLSLKEKIDRLPQALLAQAFRGELVAQDPTDEPAAVLLEKIKGSKVSGKGKQGILF